MARYSTKGKPQARPSKNLLPVWIILAGVGLLLVAAWAIWGSQSSNANIKTTGSPRLTVEKDTIDHGDVKLGSTIRDDVRVTNTGDQPLRFVQAPYIEVKEGC
jgi:hypothetical protein